MLKNLLVWIAAFAFAALSGVAAMGAIAKDRSPQIALLLSPVNGFAIETVVAELAKTSVAENVGKFPEKATSSWDVLASQAFISEPLVPEAIAVIALSHTGDVRRDLMRKAFALSRRQQFVTGWLISDSGAQDDFQGVLLYYDTTLRTSSSATNVIMPVIANALADPNFVEPLRDMLSRDPPWADRFWQEVVKTTVALENGSRLRQMLSRQTDSIGLYHDAALVRALVSNKQFANAEKLYAFLSPSKNNSSTSRNSDFRLASKYPPIDWQLFSAGEYGAFLGDGNLHLSAARNSGGRFVRQLVKLPNSKMKLEAALAEPVPQGATLSLSLSCAESVKNKPLPVRIPLEGKSISKILNNESQSCSFYWLDLVGTSADDGSGFDVIVQSISLSMT